MDLSLPQDTGKGKKNSGSPFFLPGHASGFRIIVRSVRQVAPPASRRIKHITINIWYINSISPRLLHEPEPARCLHRAEPGSHKFHRRFRNFYWSALYGDMLRAIPASDRTARWRESVSFINRYGELNHSKKKSKKNGRGILRRKTASIHYWNPHDITLYLFHSKRLIQ